MRVSDFRYLLFSMILLASTAILTEAEEPNLFRRPALFDASHELQLRGVQLAKIGQLQAGLQTLKEAAKIAPFSSVARYNLACMHAKNGQYDEALSTLKLAVEMGFRDALIIAKDPDLDSLRDLHGFAEIANDAKQPDERAKRTGQESLKRAAS